MGYLEDKRTALLMNANLGGGRLPSEYQEVEWIGSSGTQYIDTGITSAITLKWECDFQLNQYQAWQQQFMGAGGIYNSSALGLSVGQHYKIALGTRDGVNTGFNNVSADLNRHYFVIDLPNTQISIDDEIKTPSNIGFLQPKHIYLFARSNDTISYCYINIYSSKIYDNGVLIQDLVPCYRKADQVIGMYDLVKEEFLTNAGTGIFTKGNDV